MSGLYTVSDQKYFKAVVAYGGGGGEAFGFFRETVWAPFSMIDIITNPGA